MKGPTAAFHGSLWPQDYLPVRLHSDGWQATHGFQNANKTGSLYAHLHSLSPRNENTRTSQVPKDIHWPINMPQCTKHVKSGSTCSTVAKFTARQPGFNSRRVHVGFVMDEVVLRQDLFFSVREMSITITPLRHIHSFIHSSSEGRSGDMPITCRNCA